MSIDEELEFLRRLYDGGVISKQVFDEAVKKIPVEEKDEAYVDRQKMLCIKIGRGAGSWLIRVPLDYDYLQYIMEFYPADRVTGKARLRRLMRFVMANRALLNRLDRERKEALEE